MFIRHDDLITIRLPRELGDRVRELADLERENRSYVLRRLIRAGLKARDGSIAAETRPAQPHNDEAA